MATSFIEYNNHGFWIGDTLLELPLHYLCRNIEKFSDSCPEPKHQWLKEMHQLLKDNSLGYFPRYMHLGFDDYLVNTERRELFCSLVKITREELLKKGEWISAEELNSFVLNKNLQLELKHPFQIKRAIKILDSIVGLIGGEIKTAAGDPISYDW